MFTKSIDINCDVAEGLGNEKYLMPYINSCNIACTAHAGSPEIIDEVILLAKAYNVKIGAHPSFPDIENFGRKIMDISFSELQESIRNQIQLVKSKTEEQGQRLHHVKPHGALYNIAAKDTEYAKVIIDELIRLEYPVFLYAPYNSVISNLAKENGIQVMFEAFVDRNYNSDLSLVSRTLPNAIIAENETAWVQLKLMIENEELISIQGEKVKIKADTFCIHGDHENALELLQFIRMKLSQND
ncbi:lactam utilization protein LamB [Tenacibaculum sp. SZ-18]|uniref:5-oxoprolinase subunit PxpA n=1 Tax=Tenacibaculum sp. SZ-18 TaxID=754423 RepID=UPI000C2D4A5B|nr:5-oxoprolinase subunit PxpA [Tenacibaculum sp. SZ-18]AUC13961.1 lactam utilization protein LamB [Tenacibaculum sp. SZ-18]